MKLENQVVSLELSKQLKQLGVPQDSLFYWLKPIGDNGKPNGKYFLNWKGSYDFCDDDSHDHKLISAFTVAEIAEFIEQAKKDPLDKDLLDFKIRLWLQENMGYFWYKREIPSVEDLAKMLIWLIENKYLPTSPETREEKEGKYVN